MVTLVRVHNINGCFVYVHLKSTNQLGRVHVSELTTEPASFSNPLDDVVVGSSVNGAIIGQVETSHSLNKKSFKKHSDRLLEMSFVHKNSDHKCAHLNYKSGDKIIAYVKEVQKNSVVLSINPDLMAIMDTIEFMNAKRDFESLKPGVAIRCVIQSMISNTHHKRDNKVIFNVGLDVELSDIGLGCCCVGRVTKYLPNYGQVVKLAHGAHGLLPITEVDDEFSEDPQSIHPLKSVVECVVIDMEGSKNIVVSTKRSLLDHFKSSTTTTTQNNHDDKDARSKMMRSVDDFGPIGSTHKGYIKLITSHYALIMLSFKVTTKVQGHEFAKWFTPQSVNSIKLPALVAVRIVSKSENTLNVAIVDVKLKMKDSTSSAFLTDPLIDPGNRQTNSHHCLIGKCVDATIHKIDTHLGLHLNITTTHADNSNEEVLHALVPLTQVSDSYAQFPMNKHEFKPSQTLKVFVMAQSRFKNALLCSLRSSLIGPNNEPLTDPNFDNTFELAADQDVKGYVIFIAPNYISVCVSLNVIGVIPRHILDMLPPNKVKRIKLGDLLDLKVVRVLDKNHIEVCMREMSKALTDELTSIRTSSKPTKVVVAANLRGIINDKDAMRDLAFLNDADTPVGEQCVVDRTSARNRTTTKNPIVEERRKFDNPLSEEKFIREREKAIVEGSLETAQDYERECLSNPNDSQHWIRYIAFVMDSTGDMEQARHIVKRSLNVINYRNENDRFNMWICLLNLENEFGSEQSMDEVYKQAVQLCDKKQLLQRLTTIYYSSGKLLKAEEIHNLLIKKFSHSKKSWLLYLQFLYQSSRVEDARKLLPRALRVLEKKKHVDCLVKSGLLEFKYGDTQRASSIFDGILKNYPNRIDIWFVLIDQHVKQSDADVVRDLFERLLSLGLNSKRIKSVFKKYADFEKALPAHLSRFNNVQEKAMEYLKMQNSSYSY